MKPVFISDPAEVEYIIETKVAANMLKEGQIDTEIIQKIESLRSESQELINKSNELRP